MTAMRIAALHAGTAMECWAMAVQLLLLRPRLYLLLLLLLALAAAPLAAYNLRLAPPGSVSYSSAAAPAVPAAVPRFVAYDTSAPLVKPADAQTLNVVLAQSKAARLLPGDYRAAGNVTLRTGYKLYGMLSNNGAALQSRLQQVTVEAGTTGALVAAVGLERLVFQAGPAAEPTHHNEFRSLFGPAIVFEAESYVESNLFLDCVELGCAGGSATWADPAQPPGSPAAWARPGGCPGCSLNMSVVGHFICPHVFEGGGISGDFSRGGWLRNNRFIRQMVQAPWPLVSINGTHETAGNTFLWNNALGGTAQSLFQVRNASDLTVIGGDIEIYGGGTKRSLFFARDVGAVRLANAAGGLSFGGLDGGSNIGMYDIDASAFLMLNWIPDHWTGTAPDAVNQAPWDLRLGPSNRDYLRVEIADVQPHTSRIADDSDGLNNGLRANYSFGNFSFYKAHTSSARAAAKAQLRSFLQQSAGEQWPKPALPPIPDPLGPSWRALINSSTVDSTHALQGLIDSACNSTPAILPAGVYFISAPLQIGCAGDDACCGLGFIGEGSATTIIVAMSSDIDMIRPKADCNSSTVPSGFVTGFHLTMMGVTLQGGARGIHHSNCFGYQLNNAQLADVTFRDLSVAGIVFTNIYAYDNNLISHMNWVNVPTAFHQAPDGAPRIDGFCNYMDKIVFYRCQLANVSVGFNLTVGRQDDTNTWVESLFQNVTTAALTMNGNSLSMFVNCDFEAVGGDPSFVYPDHGIRDTAGASGLLHARTATKLGNGFSYQPSFIGCRFTSGPNTKSFVSPGVIFEGSSFATGQGGEAATLFPASLQSTGLVSVVMASSRVSVALGTEPANALLLNSQFDHPSAAAHNVMASVVQNGTRTVLAPGTPSADLPKSQLLCTAPPPPPN
eukprot:SAG22_NODE_427_length_10603_cov_19.158225_2_plen_897_part_00